MPRSRRAGSPPDRGPATAMLREHGLTVTPYPADAGEPQELAVANPAFPGWGRVVIDRDGFMEWDLRGTVETDDDARVIAGVIVSLLAGGEGEVGDRYGRPRRCPDAARPHP